MKSKKGKIIAAIGIACLALVIAGILLATKKHDDKNIIPGVYGAAVETKAGSFMLIHKNGKTTLEGELARSTPCVNWKMTIARTDPIAIDIIDANTSEICVQVLGTPQTLSEEIPGTTPETLYRVTFMGELVFSGALPQAAIPGAPTDGKVE